MAAPTVIPSVASKVAEGTAIAATTFDGGLDLNSAADTMEKAWHVVGVTRLSIEGTLVSGSWSTATVLVRGSIDGTNWTTIVTLTGVGFTASLDVESYRFVQCEAGVLEGGAGLASFAAYGFTPPFDRDDISVRGLFDAYDNAGGQTIDGTAATVNIDTTRTNTDTDIFGLSLDVLTVTRSGGGTAIIDYRATLGTIGSGDFQFEAWLEKNSSEVAGSRVRSGKGT